MDIKAENNIVGLKMTIDNTVKPATDANKGKDTAAATTDQQNEDNAAANAEKNKPDSEKSEDEKKSEQKSKDPTQVVKDASVDANDDKTKDAEGGVKDVKDKVEGTNEGGDNAANTSAFGLGASVGVVSNTNDANVTLGKNVVITATKPGNAETPDGSVNVSAKTLMNASAEKEDSLNLTVKNAQANSAKVEVGAAVMVSNVKNNAKILLDNEGDKSAQIKGAAVSFDASAGMGKYKTTQKKKDANGNELNETEEVDKTSTLSYAVSAAGTAEDDTPSKFVLDGSVGINTLKNNAIVLLAQKSKVDGSTVNLSADAVTQAAGNYGAKEENGKVGIGATVGIQNISGNSYYELYVTSADVKLDDPLDPYIRPNTYADYSKDSDCVKKAAKMAEESGSESEFVDKVYQYICDKVKYDYEEAKTVQSGYVPDPDEVMETGKGICFDYASLAASMLRSQGIPTKIIFGYVAPDNLYHAWNMFYTEEKGWTKVEFSVDPGDWSRVDMTFSANGQNADFIGDGSNYQDVYQY